MLSTAVPKPLPVVVYNWQRTLSRVQYDETLAPFFRNTNVLLGTSKAVNIAPTMVDISEDNVKMSWTISRRFDTTQSQSQGNSQTAIYADIQTELRALGDLAPPYNDLVERPVSDNDDFYRWPIRSLRINKGDLDRLCEQRVVLIGDAAHAMPIFAGEGGNHGLLDGVELASALADAGMQNVADAVKAGRKFYDGAVERWYHGIEASEKRLESIHRTREEWEQVLGR